MKHHIKTILVFIDWFLPGYKAGGPIRSMANMLNHLSDKYIFKIVTRNTDYLESTPYQNIEANKWVKTAENQQVIYLSADKINRNNIKSIIKETKFDTVYINGVFSFYFSILPLLTAKKITKSQIIVAPRGMLSPHGLAVKSIKKKMFTIIARLMGFYKNTTFHATYREEEKDISKLKLKQKSIFTAANLSRKMQNIENIKKNKKPGELQLISIARISPEKNTLFAIECLHNFKYKGIINLDLYGSIHDKKYWQQCTQLIKELPDNIRITHKGNTDSSLIYNILQAYHFLFLPSKGENFGHSIIESLIAACPVIISNNTPWRNLSEANVGYDIDLRKQHIFAEIIQKAIDMNAENYSKMQIATQQYIKVKLKTKETIKLYEKLFDE